MNISKFFIDRPIFAAVLSVLILLAGLLAVFRLPISEYPAVVPPSVVVRAQFPGANPKVIAETVAAPLEEAINGVENMLYMQSQANSDGNLTVTVNFHLGMDPDKAQQLVQNRVAQALPRLPEDVQRLGVTTVKATPTLTMVVHLVSPDQRYDLTYLRNYEKEFWARIEQTEADHPGDARAQIIAYFTGLGERSQNSMHRGCGLSNAAVEYPERDHPARLVSEEHKRAFRRWLHAKAAEMGAENSDSLGDGLLLLFEGAHLSGQLFSGDGPSAALADTVQRLVESHRPKG